MNSKRERTDQELETPQKQSDITELEITGYTEWPALSEEHNNLRIWKDNTAEKGYEDIFQIREGLTVRIVDVELFESGPYPIIMPGETISITFTLRGKSRWEASHGKVFDIPEEAVVLFYLEPEEHYLEHCTAGEQSTIVELYLSKELLQTEALGLDVESLPRVFDGILKEDCKIFFDSIPLDAEIRSALKILMFCTFSGGCRNMFLAAKAQELLCLTIRAFLRREESLGRNHLPAKDVENMKQVAEILRSTYTDPSSVDELANTMGINKSKLQEQFKLVYGCTISNYLANLRMQRACELLETRGAQVSEVAWQLGYKHSCNFVTAFKRMYGMTPKSYQKNWVKDNG